MDSLGMQVLANTRSLDNGGESRRCVRQLTTKRVDAQNAEVPGRITIFPMD